MKVLKCFSVILNIYSAPTLMSSCTTWACPSSANFTTRVPIFINWYCPQPPWVLWQRVFHVVSLTIIYLHVSPPNLSWIRMKVLRPLQGHVMEANLPWPTCVLTSTSLSVCITACGHVSTFHPSLFSQDWDRWYQISWLDSLICLPLFIFLPDAYISSWCCHAVCAPP